MIDKNNVINELAMINFYLDIALNTLVYKLYFDRYKEIKSRYLKLANDIIHDSI